MNYFRSYTFIFDNPKWLTTLLIGVVCNLVPVAGPLVLSGYLYEIIEALHRDPDRPYPDFDFNRLIEYLMRGLWPFLISLIAMLPLMVLIASLNGTSILMFVLVFRENPPEYAWFLLGIPCLLLLVCCVLLFMALTAMVLRAGLAQDFRAGFSWPFIRDFVARVWPQMILAQLFMMVTAPLVMMLGLAVFCVGVYVAQVWIFFASYHLHYQLYELYLQRGGAPIPLKSRVMAPDHRIQGGDLVR